MKYDVYLQDVPGFPAPQGCIRRLKRSLYELRIAPRLWNLEITKFLVELGLRQSKSDPCLFFSSTVVLGLYVDDIVLGFWCGEEVTLQVIEKIQDRFKSKYLGLASHLLGLKVDQQRKSIHVDQSTFVDML